VGNLSVAPQNQQEDEDGTGHPSGSSGLLRLEASRTKVSQSSLKTGGGAAWMMHAASSWRSREEKLKTDGSMRRATLDSSSPTFLFSLY
jgi:hypothetical protein